MTTLISDLIAMSHDLPLMAAAGKLPQNTCDAWVKTVEEAVKDSQMLDFVIQCLNEKTPDEFNAMVWHEFQRGSTRFDRGSIAAAMQKESEVVK